MSKITPKALPDVPVYQSVQPASFGRYREFKLEDAALGYTYESPTVMPQRVPRPQVVDSALALVNNPFQVGLHYVSSTLDAERPNLFASFVARRAHHLYDQGLPRNRRSSFGPPEFRYVMGSFNQIDRLMDRITNNWPIVLVLAGLDMQSTPAKWDAARDIIGLATRCDTTVIVTVAGAVPHAVHYERLRLPAASYVNLAYPDIDRGGIL